MPLVIQTPKGFANLSPGLRASRYLGKASNLFLNPERVVEIFVVLPGDSFRVPVIITRGYPGRRPGLEFANALRRSNQLAPV
jgi:hypothetical protein